MSPYVNVITVIVRLNIGKHRQHTNRNDSDEIQKFYFLKDSKTNKI